MKYICSNGLSPNLLRPVACVRALGFTRGLSRGSHMVFGSVSPSRVLALTAIGLLIGACTENSTSPTPSAASLKPRAGVYYPPDYQAKRSRLCKVGPDGFYSFTGSFSPNALVTQGGNGVFLHDNPFPLTASSCTEVFEGGMVDDDIWLREIDLPPGIVIDKIVVQEDGGNCADDADYCPQTFTGVDQVKLTTNAMESFTVTFYDKPSTGVCEDQTATNPGQPLPCLYPPPPGKTFTIGPSSMEGHLKIAANTWFNGGYSFKFKSNTHLATQFTVTAKVEVTVSCPYGGGPGGTILIPLGTVTYNVPAGNTNWLPTGDANSILSWMGAVKTPDLCGGFLMDNARGAVFTATVSQNPPSGSLVDFRFKYRNPAAKGKVDTNCTDANEPKRNDAATCGASWSQTVLDP